MGSNRKANVKRLSGGGELIKEELLQILGCPLEEDRPPLLQQDGWLVCTSCGAKFPIVDGVPNLLPESAVKSEQKGASNGGN